MKEGITNGKIEEIINSKRRDNEYQRKAGILNGKERMKNSNDKKKKLIMKCKDQKKNTKGKKWTS